MKILTIPGIGDIHWVMLKMESFIQQNCRGEIPEIHIWNFDNRPRSADFVKRIPFVKFGGYFNQSLEIDKRRFNASYMRGQYSEIKEFHGFDSYLCVNGGLRIGHNIENILPQYKVNWDYEINLNGCSTSIKEPYIIFYFSNHGMFTNWVNHLPPEKIKDLLAQIKGYKLILTGSTWDAPFNELLESENVINMCGDTSLNDLLGLIKGASAFVGWCGGNTIISQHLNTPTLMLWSNYFEKPFQTNWVSPDRLGKMYIPMNVEGLNFDEFNRNLGELLERKATLAS
jgi:hypothetical protein